MLHKQTYLLKILIFFQTLCWQKRESPPVGFEPDASHLPDECPTTRPQRIPVLPITYPSDLLWSHWAVTIIIYKTSSVHPIRTCVTTAHLFHASVWMAYHHLNNEFSSVFLLLKILIFFQTLCWQKRESPPVGFEPDASCLPDECPTARPQRIHVLPITYPSDLLWSHWAVTIIIYNIFIFAAVWFKNIFCPVNTINISTLIIL